MNLNIDKDWFEKRAKAEGNLEIGAGRRLTMTIDLTPEEVAELAKLQFEALPKWAQDHIRELEALVERYKSDRAYTVGFNDGWTAATATP